MKLSPWALTVLSAGGTEIYPQNTADTGLLSNRRNVYWAYTDINDERFYSTNKYATLKQESSASTAFKIGTNNEDGWAAYHVNNQLFVKRFSYDENSEYSDYGCNFETYTNQHFLECESLGPLKSLEKGDSNYLTEEWSLKNVTESFDRKDEKSISDFVKKHIEL